MDSQDLHHYRFSGIERLFGRPQYEKLKKSKVLVVGLGGVGSWCAESLARSGLGKLVLMDFDDICISNTNRQLQALSGAEGKMKTQVLSRRLRQINPEMEVEVIEEAYSSEIEDRIFQSHFDIVVDAIDDSIAKYDLIMACKARNIPLVISGAAGGRRDPSEIRCTDLSKSREDKMLSLLRKRLRQKAGFPRKGSMKIPCVFSLEKPSYWDAECGVGESKPEEFKKPLDCSTGFGTASHITGTFGFHLSYLALKELFKDL